MFLRIKILIACCAILLCAFHPYYVSVTELKYKEEDKTLQVSCRTFTNDLEIALKKIYKKPIDLLHPKDKAVVEKTVAHYMLDHLKINVNGKPQTLDFVGYEKEEEAIWSYFEIKGVELPKTLKIENSILYDFLPQQVNMVHADVKGNKQSSKVTNPDKEISLVFGD